MSEGHNHGHGVGRPVIVCTADLARGVSQRSEACTRLFGCGVAAIIGVLHQTGHAEPWIVAMVCPPGAAAVREHGFRSRIEPMLSDFRRRGFGVEETQGRCAARADHRILILTLAM